MESSSMGYASSPVPVGSEIILLLVMAMVLVMEMALPKVARAATIASEKVLIVVWIFNFYYL